MEPGFLRWLPAFLMLSLAGCAVSGLNKRSAAESPELVGEFITGAYCGPTPEETTQERYLEMADAGLDLLVPGNGTFDGPGNRKVLDLAQRSGLRILPVDVRVFPFSLSSNVPIDVSLIDAMVRDYRAHPAFAGYVVRDEPNAAAFPRLAEICRLFRERDPGHAPLINLFPGYASQTQLGAADFPTYLRRYIEMVEPDILSYDHYPLRVGGGLETDWHGDLAIVREETRRAGIPFWIFVQAEGIRGNLRVPNRPEVFWQANTALAYGARGIFWFCCWTPQPNQDFPKIEGAPPPLVESHHDAMIDRDGKRTPLWDHAREENLFLRKAGRALIGWDNKFLACYSNGRLRSGTGPALGIEVEPGSRLVVGTFTRKQHQRLVLANDSFKSSCQFTLHPLPDGPRLKKTVASLESAASKTAHHWKFILGPGGCVVIDLAH